MPSKQPHVCGPNCIDIGLPGIHVALFPDALSRRLRTTDPVEFREASKVSKIATSPLATWSSVDSEVS